MIHPSAAEIRGGGEVEFIPSYWEMDKKDDLFTSLGLKAKS